MKTITRFALVHVVGALLRLRCLVQHSTVVGLLAFTTCSAAELYMRVVDVGAGECVVLKLPGPYYVVYDAGNYEDNGASAMAAIRQIIPNNAPIDLLVLSHSDADHLGAVDEIMDEYRVKRVIHSGYVRTTGTWQAANGAINAERDNDGCIDINLAKVEYPSGATYRLGDTFVTMVAGFHKPPQSWGTLSLSEERNAGSIVIRVLYAGKSILLCGDAVGRHIGDPPETCIAIEQLLVQNAPAIPIDSDVIVAPHHGADNGSSLPFIRAVSPEYVIFSAGHDYQHPRKTTADRYLAAGVALNKMYRTDRGDDEGSTEWAHQRVAGNVDRKGDDDVEVTISNSGVINVKYRE